MNDKRVYLCDVTLRDGAQTQGVDFTLEDKIVLAKEMDAIGIDYVEGGWPGANQVDTEFFNAPPPLPKGATLSAFGMTRRHGRSVANDPGLAALLNTKARSICMVGKAWDFQVQVALEIPLDDNIAMISESIKHVSTQGRETMFDAEHFFDGFKANPDYALECIRSAWDNGARWVVLCDTNGGTMPDEVEEIVRQATNSVPGTHVGIHAHNDTENAVANSLAAVRAGARQVQATINGLGERCGNANMISLIPNLMLKMGYETGVTKEKLSHLTGLSRLLDERLNRAPLRVQAWVGESAFAHKGGLHVSAVLKDTRTYEHVSPELVGNARHVVVSDQSGRSNLIARLQEARIDTDKHAAQMDGLLEIVKEQEYIGYSYDGAEASFELLAREHFGELPNYFDCHNFRVMDERRWNAKGELITLSEATIKLRIDDTEYMSVAEGNGPVNALDGAIRKVLIPIWPCLGELTLVDYKVRILTPGDGTGAITRVMIETRDSNGTCWNTVGVSANIIDASYNALRDSLVYKLFHRVAT